MNCRYLGSLIIRDNTAPDPLLVIGDIEEDDRVSKPVPVQVHGRAEVGLGDVGYVVNPLKIQMITSSDKKTRVMSSF